MVNETFRWLITFRIRDRDSRSEHEDHMKEQVNDELGNSDEAAERMVPALSQLHRAEISLMVSERAGFKANLEITNAGLLSVAALVSSILLSTAVLVGVAVRSSRR